MRLLRWWFTCDENRWLSIYLMYIRVALAGAVVFVVLAALGVLK
jgi:hypothetical protein